MIDIPTLETPRLRLRGHRLDDFDAHARQYGDPAIARFLGGQPFTRNQSWPRFLRYAGLWHHLGFGYLVVEEKATGDFVGEMGFLDLLRGMTPSLDGTMEAGWALGAQFHGRGYAQEALGAVLDWARDHGPRDRITCIIDPDNERSLRLARKFDFREFARGDLNGRTMIMLERPRRL